MIRLTADGTALLKGERSCVLYREHQPPPGKSRRRPAGSGATPGAGGSVSDALFDALREVRRRLARDRGVPPYVIFHDTTLRDMAERRPRTVDDLHDVYGVGAKKAADFGELFLEVIRAHASR